MKILLLGDYSNCHRTLAKGLEAEGCRVTLASDGSKWMDCARNIDISRRPGKAGGLIHYVGMQSLLRNSLKGFDIVAINDPNFTSLRPERLRELFDVLRNRNGKVFLTMMSTDIPFLDMLAAPDSPIRYSEWFVDGRPARMNAQNPGMWEAWHNKALVDYHNYVYDHIDGAVSVLYEYHKSLERRLPADRIAYAGLPIDTSEHYYEEIPWEVDKVKIFLGRDRTRQLMKGSDLLEQAARIVMKRHPDKAEFTLVENVPYSEFSRKLRDSHVVLDQIYSYTPAMTALMAMSTGRVAVSGGEPEYYDFIGERELRPVVNAPIELDALEEALEELVVHPEQLRERGLQSRMFVDRHNDSRVVARRFLDFWTK